MTTALEIIARASKRLNVLNGEETLVAAEAVDALQKLNDLLHGFGPMGIHYSHITLEATDTLNVPDEQVRNVTAMLAGELADEYGITLTPKLVADIMAAKLELQAAYYSQRPGIVDSALLSNRFGSYNILRDG